MALYCRLKEGRAEGFKYGVRKHLLPLIGPIWAKPFFLVSKEDTEH